MECSQRWHAFTAAAAFLLFGSTGARAEPFAYFVQKSASTVQAVDVATNTLVQTFYVPTNPVAVAASGAARAYVISEGTPPPMPHLATFYDPPTTFDPALTIIDTATQTIVGRVPLSYRLAPRYVAVTADGARVFIVSYLRCIEACIASLPAWNIAMFDSRSQQVSSILDLSNRDITDIAMLESLGRLYLADAATGTVLVVDTSANALAGVIGIVPMGLARMSLAANVATSRIYAGFLGNGAGLTGGMAGPSVWVIDANTNSTVSIKALSRPVFDIAVDSSASTYYVVTDTDIEAYSVATNAPLWTLALTGLTPADGIGVTADGRYAYVSRGSAGKATEISLATTPPSSREIALGGWPHAEGQFITGAAPVSPPVLTAVPLTGLWWNPSQPGWGMHLTQRGNTVFGAWFTYDRDGNAKWYVAPSCRMWPNLPCDTCVASSSCTSELYETRGPRFFVEAFDAARVQRANVGTLQLRFDDANHASASYVLNNVAGGYRIERQVFAPGAVADPDYTDIWYNAQEPGWGLGVVQQGNVMFLAWYEYNDYGYPSWHVASNCAMRADGRGCSGALYRAWGPHGPVSGMAFDRSKMSVGEVGAIDVSFSGPNDGVIRYQVDGHSGTKTIMRQVF